jgi:hypothetical protein
MSLLDERKLLMILSSMIVADVDDDESAVEKLS